MKMADDQSDWQETLNKHRVFIVGNIELQKDFWDVLVKHAVITKMEQESIVAKTGAKFQQIHALLNLLVDKKSRKEFDKWCYCLLLLGHELVAEKIMPAEKYRENLRREKGRSLLEEKAMFSRHPGYVMDGRTLNEIDIRQYAVCSLNCNYQCIGTGFLFAEKQECTCENQCTCRVVCTCFHVISRYLPQDRGVVEGIGVTFYDNKNSQILPFVVKEVLAYSSDLDYAFLSLMTKPQNVRPIINFGRPPPPHNKIHIVGFNGTIDRKVETNIEVVNVDSFLSNHWHKLSAEDHSLLKNEHTLAYQCACFHGFSGSPLFDDTGRVVAIHRRGFENEGGSPGFLIEMGVKFIAVLIHAHEKFKMFPDSREHLLRLYSE